LKRGPSKRAAPGRNTRRVANQINPLEADMATRKVITRRKLRKAKPPRSLVDAVEQNFEITEQLSSWRFAGANCREGFFLLKKKGSKTLMVKYRALYDLGKPYFLEP
jgi:hypothetical protein